MKKKIMFTLAILVLAFGVATCLKTQAGTGESGAGWLGGWSDDGTGNSTGLGRISMNSINCDTNGDGTIDNAACISAGADGGIANYGLSIPTNDGNFSGPGYYAWSPNVGWVSFSPSDLTGCPTGTCTAQRMVNDIQGWARIIGIKSEYEKVPSNSGGWQGWVKLNGTAQDGSPYGVSINGTNLQGYAWSDELGWIDFSLASIIAPKTITASISAAPSIVSDSATPVSITANVTGGTAMGGMVYELDCDNSGTFTDGKFPASGTTIDITHEFANACTYSATSTVAVRITRDGVIVTPTASVIFGCIDNYCDTDFQCKTQLKASGCNAICDTTTCKAPQNANWKEVAP